LQSSIDGVQTELDNHEAKTSNPHSVTKSQVGLNNVVNADTTTTANISDSTNKRFVTDANLTTIGNQSGTNTGDETTATIKSKLGITTLSGSNTGDQDLSGLQPLDSDLTAIAALTPSNDDFIQRKSGAWTNRTIAQVRTDLAIPQAIRGQGTAITIPASSTRFVLQSSGVVNGTESNTQLSCEFAMTATGIVVRTSSAQPASGSLVFTLRKNGADTGIVLTIAANAAAGVYSATGSVAFAAGDLMSLRVVNNATATSTNMLQISTAYNA
jgi:hypothetical protein